jgi:hypothetical protein
MPRRGIFPNDGSRERKVNTSVGRFCVIILYIIRYFEARYRFFWGVEGGGGIMSSGGVERVNSVRKTSSVRNVTQKYVAGRTFTLKSENQAVSSDSAPRSEPSPAAVNRVEESKAAAPPVTARPGFRRNLGLTDRSADGDMVEISKGAVTLSHWYLERIQETPSLVFTLGLDQFGQEDERKSKAFQELLNAIKEAEVRSGRAPAAPDPGWEALRAWEDAGLPHGSRTPGGQAGFDSPGVGDAAGMRPGSDPAGAVGTGGTGGIGGMRAGFDSAGAGSAVGPRPDFASPGVGGIGGAQSGFGSAGTGGTGGAQSGFDLPGVEGAGGSRLGFDPAGAGGTGDMPPVPDSPGAGAGQADYAAPRRPVYRAATDQSAGLLAEKRKKEALPDSSSDRAREIRGADGAEETRGAGDIEKIRDAGGAPEAPEEEVQDLASFLADLTRKNQS